MSKRVVAIIQARMGSTRVPGKTMVDLNGQPLIWRIIERTRRAKVDEVVVATTDDLKDDVLCEYLERHGVRSFRGPTNDLYLRYLEAGEASKADVITQIYGDSPCIDPDIIDLSLIRMGRKPACFTAGYPRGLNAYSFTMDRWRMGMDFSLPHAKEFHHQYLTIGAEVVPCSWDIHGFDFTVDVPEDLEYIRTAYRELGDDFGCDMLVQWAMHKAIQPSDGRKRNI